MKRFLLCCAFFLLGSGLALSAAPQINVAQLRELLLANPELVLDVLRQHSEEVLNIAQEGAIQRRDRATIAQWKQDLTQPKTIRLSGRPMRGAANAPVTIVAFSDFTCPYCQNAAENLRKLMELHPADIRYVFKNFPRAAHGNGRLAAEYFAAASLQNPEKAWALYDALFAARGRVEQEGEALLSTLAAEAGLDMKRLTSDIKSKKVSEIIEEDLAEATRLRVEGTPTFFVNNLVVRGAASPALFAKAYEMALDAAKAKP